MIRKNHEETVMLVGIYSEAASAGIFALLSGIIPKGISGENPVWRISGGIPGRIIVKLLGESLSKRTEKFLKSQDKSKK